MERPARSKSKIFSFLPRATSVTFHNLPFSPVSPVRDKRPELKTITSKGFSGSIISIIPAEARRKSRSGSFDSKEPTSPKVSCIGQIKHKKKISKSKGVSPVQDSKPVSSPREAKKPASAIQKLFHGVSTGRKSDVSDNRSPLKDRAPSLSQMKRFASGRDTLANFDWTAHVTVEPDHRNYDSHKQREESEQEAVIIPDSAPIMVGEVVALEPKKEVNLWKRRTMAPPMPLQLKMDQPKW